MLILIKHLFLLLSSDQRRRFFLLQFLVIVMGVTEVFGVVSIVPFMALVGDMGLVQKNPILAKIYEFSGLESEIKFVFFIGLSVLIIFLISAIISIFTTWRLSMFANKVGTDMADRLYTYYLKQGWLFHTNRSSAQLTKKISNETLRVTNAILTPLMLINARLVLALFISMSIFIYDPLVATLGLLAYAIAYFILYKFVRVRLLLNGRAISRLTETRFRLMNEGFGGIKEILLLGRDTSFIKKFNNSGKFLANSQGTNATLAAVPRYFVELFAFGSMILLVLYLIAFHEGNLGLILPIISVYALATFKLLPAFQLIYASTAQIKGNIAAFESIKEDLTEAMRTGYSIRNSRKKTIFPKEKIHINNISFSYPEQSKLALKSVNIEIPVNQVIGIVGPSGSGKTTLADILLGLIQAQDGELKIDNIVIDDGNRRQWQNAIGFVSQSIFLSEGTISENVAFGVDKNEINIEQVRKAIQLSHLEEFINSLEKGLNTKVGERGVKLSGGQRQRIGIARSLYHEVEVLILDEATSSLDGISEKKIMNAINDFSGKKTIIMIAHRLKTIQKCNKIFFMEDGRVVDQGTFEELINTNNSFRKLSELS